MKSLSTAIIGGLMPAQSLAVPAMLSNLYESLTQLEQNQEMLRTRLHPVLETVPMQDDEGKECAACSQARSVPHAEQLEGIVSRVDRLNNFTLDALNRLHV
jgi:hypothetical protein